MFSLEQSKSGKPCIMFNNFKFRLHRVLKSGDISWQCLGRNCGATIKSNANITKVEVCNEKHSGVHPVTMRSLSSPRRQALTAPATPTPSAASPQPAAAQPPPVPPLTSASHTPLCSTPVPDIVSPSATPSAPLHPASLSTPALELSTENALLKAEVAKLKADVKVILDHSIESDQRLLEFTEEIFTGSSSVTSLLKPLSKSVNQFTQTENHPEDSDTELKNCKKIMKELEDELYVLRQPCHKCLILRSKLKK